MYLVCILLFTECSIWSPEYSKPNLGVPGEWANYDSSFPIGESNLPYIAWWEQFNDPNLNSLIESGLINNNSIAKARGNLEQARGQLKAVELSWIPNLSAYAGYSSNPSFGAPLGFYGVWPQYAMFNIFNTIAMQKSAELRVEAQNKAVEATKLVLIGQIANSYYTYIAQIEQLRLYSIYIKDLEETLDIQKAEYKGDISNVILIKNISEKVNMAISEQKVIENNIKRSQNAINYLLNQNPGKLKAQTNFSGIKTNFPNIATLPATVLANRPDVSIAELEYRLAVQNKGSAYSTLLPSVQLDNFQGSGYVTDPSPLGSYLTMSDAYIVWTLNPTIFGQIEALKGAQKSAYYNYIDTVRKALRDVDNDLINHKTANERFSFTNKALDDSKHKYSLTEDLYKTGIAPYSNLLNLNIS